MSLSIDQLLAEADEEIAGLQKESKQEEQDHTKGNPYGDEESVKLAHFLEDMADENPSSGSNQQEKQASQSDDEGPVTEEELDRPFAKIAYALAILETAMNSEKIAKMDNFVKKAQEAGYSEEKIQEFLDKQARSRIDPKILKSLGALAGLGATGAAAGYGGYQYGKKKGRKKGRQSGYVEGVRDYDKALRQRVKQRMQRAYGR